MRPTALRIFGNRARARFLSTSLPPVPPRPPPHDGIEIYKQKQKPDQQGISPAHAGIKVWKTTQTESISRSRGADVRGEDGDRRRREGGATGRGGARAATWAPLNPAPRAGCRD